jgi:hypothetical protein
VSSDRSSPQGRVFRTEVAGCRARRSWGWHTVEMMALRRAQGESGHWEEGVSLM